jgi:hypothetical protein|tara:strand:- start:34 stop:381 length:348 start_codon:yes stop_codon:yes gene_type:complete
VLEEFLDTNAELFEHDYVVLKIDVEEMQNGGTVATRLRQGREGGIPWITILNADGQEIVTSDGPQGNIGCPITKGECGYFITMIEKSSQHASTEQVTDIAKALDEYAQKRREKNN